MNWWPIWNKTLSSLEEWRIIRLSHLFMKGAVWVRRGRKELLTAQKSGALALPSLGAGEEVAVGNAQPAAKVHFEG